MANLNDIKSWFRTGKFPTESQFSQTWDSFWHKAEKISLSAVEGLSQILSSKADRDLVDRQVEDLRTNKENVGVARDLVNAHNVAPDAHEALFALKANDADVYHRDVLDARFSRHEEDEEMHLQEGEREAWNAHKADATLHKTSEQIRSEIVDADIPSTIARDSEVEEKLTTHNGSTSAHADIRSSIRNLETGATLAGRSEFATKLGTAEDSYTKAQLDGKINKHIRNVTYDAVSAKFTFTFEDGTRTEIDTPLEHTVRDGRYDASTGELVLVLVSGSEIRIPAAGLVKVYAGRETPTTSTTINSAGEVRVDLKQHSVDKTHLVQPLVDELNSYATQDWVRGQGYTKNTGTVTQVKVGAAAYNPVSGVVSLPAYPTMETAATIMQKINSQNEITFTKHVVCGAGAGTASTSDFRFKKQIEPLKGALDALLDWPVFYYRWENEDHSLSDKTLGLSAQEVRKIFPELVYEMQDARKTLTLDYSKITALLVKALQEQNETILDLKNKLQGVLERLEKLENDRSK